MTETKHEWIAKRIDEARKGCPVREAIALAIKAQLQGTMHEHSLRPAELAALAKTLLNEGSNPSGGDVVK